MDKRPGQGRPTTGKEDRRLGGQEVKGMSGQRRTDEEVRRVKDDEGVLSCTL